MNCIDFMKCNNSQYEKFLHLYNYFASNTLHMFPKNVTARTTWAHIPSTCLVISHISTGYFYLITVQSNLRLHEAITAGECILSYTGRKINFDWSNNVI